MVERLVYTERAGGSSPSPPTMPGTSMSDNIRASITEMVRDQLEWDKRFAPAILDPNRSLRDQGADMMDMLELWMALEEEFNKPIPEADAEGLTTVNKMVQYVEHTEG